MPRVAFVSYSHDSADHKAWVLRLATDLRSSGVDARLDRWGLRPGEEAGQYMARAVAGSEKVLVICTSEYVRKADEREGGAGFESALVTAELVRDQGTAKFIPVLKDNEAGSTPSYLAGRIYVDFRRDDTYEESLTTLLRAIEDLPPIDAPPIGDSPIQPNCAAEPARPAVVVHSIAEEIEELLQNPHRRIQLSKVLWSIAEAARERLITGSFYDAGAAPTPELLISKVREAEDAMAPLVPALVVMGSWATADQVAPLAQLISRFVDMPQPNGSYYEANRQIALYPALIALYTAGLGALSQERLDNLHAFLFAGVPSSQRNEPDQAFVEALHRGAPFAQEFWKLLPGMERRHTPLSDHLLAWLRSQLPDLLGPEERAARQFDRLEVIVSLGYRDAVHDRVDSGWAPLGSYLWRDASAPARLKADLARLQASSPLLRAGFFEGSIDRATAEVDHLVEHVRRVRAQNGVF